MHGLYFQQVREAELDHLASLTSHCQVQAVQALSPTIDRHRTSCYDMAILTGKGDQLMTVCHRSIYDAQGNMHTANGRSASGPPYDDSERMEAII
jgi:hypothetical protein